MQGILQYTAEDPEQTEKVKIEGGEVVVYEAELSPDGRSIVSVGAEVGRGHLRCRGRLLDRPAGSRRLRRRAADRHVAGGCRARRRGSRPAAPAAAANQRRNVLFNLAEGEAGSSGDAGCQRLRPGRSPVRGGHQVRPDHRHVRGRPLPDLRHDRTRQLRPLRDDHVRRRHRVLLQRHARHPADRRRAAGDGRRRRCSAPASTWAYGARCAAAARGWWP